VESAARVFLDTKGDIRKVMRHILTSGDFMRSSGTKFRRPLDLLVAMIRATGATFDYPPVLQDPLTVLGQLPFAWRPPDGYPDFTGAWLNTGALLNRWNTAMLIAGATWDESGIHIPYSTLAPASYTPTAADLVDTSIQAILNGSIRSEDRSQLIDFVADGGPASSRVTYETREVKLPALVGLLMSSPYFQWH
jgi:uncharacterized protein (DUF1800 family)